MVLQLTREQFNQGVWETAVDQMEERWFYHAIKQLEPEL
jgi:hypothetical protein